MNNIMLDIETVSSNCTSAVIQISMVKFDWKTGSTGVAMKMNLNLDEQLQRGLNVNADTIAWWTKTNPEMFNKILTNYPVSVEQALNAIQEFVSFDDYVWCHATFDAPIIANLFKVYGKKIPWKYTKVRDIRTLVDLAGLDLSQYDWNKEKTHDSMDDCVFQIKYCCDAYRKLKEQSVEN